jgi:hypothetical protein
MSDYYNNNTNGFNIQRTSYEKLNEEEFNIEIHGSEIKNIKDDYIDYSESKNQKPKTINLNEDTVDPESFFGSQIYLLHDLGQKLKTN